MRARYASVIVRELCPPERIASCRSAIGVSSNSNDFTGVIVVALAASSLASPRLAGSAGENVSTVPATPPRKNVLRFISGRAFYRPARRIRRLLLGNNCRVGPTGHTIPKSVSTFGKSARSGGIGWLLRLLLV